MRRLHDVYEVIEVQNYGLKEKKKRKSKKLRA